MEMICKFLVSATVIIQLLSLKMKKMHDYYIHKITRFTHR